MRRFLRSALLIVLTCSFAGCAREQVFNDSEVVGNDLLECSLAGLEEVRSSLGEGYRPVWKNGDAISVMWGEGSRSKFSLVDGAETANGVFRGILPSGPKYFSAFYPWAEDNSFNGGKFIFSVPSTQIASPSDFDGRANVMVSCFDAVSRTPAFYNVFGLLEIRLSGDATVGSLTITSNRDTDRLWGSFSLDIDGRQGSNGQTLVSAGDGSASLTLKLSTPVALSEDSAQPFFFLLPPGTLSEGFSLDVFDRSGKSLASIQTDLDRTISRGAVRLMETVGDVNGGGEAGTLQDSFTWAAYNSFGRSAQEATVIDPDSYPGPRGEKYVGMFYFIWHTYWSKAGAPIRDNQKLLGNNYGYDAGVWPPVGGCCNNTPHFWGESYFGYYRDDDLWVLRKQAQMLSDAGVDFIAFDLTNNVFYENDVRTLLDLFLQIRSEGKKTPQVCFMIWHSGANGDMSTAPFEYKDFNHRLAIDHVYQEFYTRAQYEPLWFKWEDKPLILAIKEHASAAMQNYFTFRRGWWVWNDNYQTACDGGDPWWRDAPGGKGVDCWPWGCSYTEAGSMAVGTHNGVNECVGVCPATHPVSNIGRSFRIGNDWQSKHDVNGVPHPGSPDYPKDPGKGIYFKQQFEAALELDPQVMFFTGWNEYLVGHATAPELEFRYMCGKDVTGNPLFIDQYNHEYSRDIEPVKGGFGDNYYYYLVDFIRRFKGVPDVPVYKKYTEIGIDGDFSDWTGCSSVFVDDAEDTKWRGYNGFNEWPTFNTNFSYSNRTGRNDLRNCRIATDGENLYLYVDALSDLSGYADGATGLNLFLKAGSGASKWEDFNFMLVPTGAASAELSSCNSDGAWSWAEVQNSGVCFAAVGNAMELSIPLSTLGIVNPDNFTVEFKWVDNVNLGDSDGIQQCMRDGDSAPNGRFRYRYRFRKKV